MARLRAALAVILGTVLVAGCTDDATGPEQSTQAVTALPDAATLVVEGTSAVEIAAGTSRALYRSAPAVVLVGEEDEDALPRAAEVAESLGVPLLVTPAPPATPAATASAATTASASPTVSAGPTTSPEPSAATGSPEPASAEPGAEIERLGARTVVTAGAAAAQWAQALSLSTSTVDDPTPEVRRGEPLTELTVLALPTGAAAAATARAAGAQVLELGTADPRATPDSIAAVVQAKPGRVLALGSAFGSAQRLAQRLATAATGVELPGGGQIVFPGRRMIALYGHPGDGVLGVLGEQDLDATIERARRVAAQYEGLVGEPFIPAFEIITTVASASAGGDGNYSTEFPVEKYKPWVEAALEAGIYVMLDLQPGRTDFLTQAKLYEELLRYPHVGLALDPEWRLKPDQVHMVQIGTVTAAEINETGAWLAELVREHDLPQKVLMLHQFQTRMIENRSTLVTDYDELRVVIHADGFGGPSAKRNTWNALHIDEPDNILWGWKNFYDEDTPTFTPAETIAVAPDEIVFVSYQ